MYEAGGWNINLAINYTEEKSRNQPRVSQLEAVWNIWGKISVIIEWLKYSIESNILRSTRCFRNKHFHVSQTTAGQGCIF